MFSITGASRWVKQKSELNEMIIGDKLNESYATAIKGAFFLFLEHDGRSDQPVHFFRGM